MNQPITSSARTVLILKSDRLYAETLRQHAVHVFPSARVLATFTINEAAAILRTEEIDLFITGIGTHLQGDVFDLLHPSRASFRRADHVLVITGNREYRLLTCLRTLDIDGVFDSSHETPEQLLSVMASTAAGQRYWSPTILQHMQHTGATSTAHFRLLTVFEQVVLSVIGDGCDDTVASRELGLSPATVSTVRRELHRKLGVQHRGELVRVAAQNGFVRFTPAGVVRPGFALLAEAYNARRTKRGTSSSCAPRPAAQSSRPVSAMSSRPSGRFVAAH